ncbi:MAG: hypothetical protein ACRYGR_10320 [Janthinobacterium lividum]
MSHKKAILLISIMAVSLGTLQATATTQLKDYREMAKADTTGNPFDSFKAPTAWGFDMKKVEEHVKEGRYVQSFFQNIIQYRDIKRQIEQLNKEKAGYESSIASGKELLKQQLDHNSGSNASKKDEIKMNSKKLEDTRTAKLAETNKKIAEHQAQLDKLAPTITNPTRLTAEQVSKIPTH